MPESFMQLLKRHARQKLGPHGANPKYHVMYAKASKTIGDWIIKRGTPKQLCAAACDGLPVIEQALSEVTDDSQNSLELARWTVQNELKDIRDEDLLMVLGRLAPKKDSPRPTDPYYIVLASGAEWPCPFCKQGHGEWTLAQLRRGIAFLQQDGNSGPAPSGG